jgi:hypothetical protein
MAMKFGAVANPQQVATMAGVVDAYCRHVGFAPGTPEREDVAAKILALHDIGVRGQNDLLRALILPPVSGRA